MTTCTYTMDMGELGDQAVSVEYTLKKGHKSPNRDEPKDGIELVVKNVWFPANPRSESNRYWNRPMIFLNTYSVLMSCAKHPENKMQPLTVEQHEFTINVATSAQHIYDGVMCKVGGNRVDEILDAWDLGHVELTIELAKYAYYSENHLIKHKPDGWDFLGVYDYEVSHPFGKWFGDYLLEYGKAPAKEVAFKKFDELFTEFFAQGETNGSR